MASGTGEHHGADSDRLVEWVNLPDWARSQEFLAAHPGLIGDTGIAELHRQAARQPRAVQVLMLDDHAWLLDLCRSLGIAGGYARYEEVVAAHRRLGGLPEQAEQQFTVTSDPARLDSAVRLRREIVELVGHGSRSRVRAAHLDLGRVLVRSYLGGAGPAALDAAIEALTAAWRVPGAVARTQAPIAELLARGLRMRYEQHGSPEDLARCIGTLDDTVQALPDDSATLPGLLGACGEALRLRHRRTGSPGDLERAVECFERAEAFTAELVGRHPARLGDLGTGLVERYQLSGAPTDLDRAVSAFERALAGTPEGSPDRAAHLVNLGNALLLRFWRRGDETDLTSATAHLARADDELPATSPLRHALHAGLASGLGVRYEQTNTAPLLDHAIEHAETAVALGPPTAAASGWGNLGRLLVARAERAERSEERGVVDLDRAVAALERSLAAVPAPAPGQAGRMVGLAGGLATRYLRTGTEADLERAVTLLRTACGIERGPHEAGAHLDLGNVLWIRYGRTRRLDDLDEALAELRGAEAMMPTRSADRPGCLNSLAVGLAERFRRRRDPADLSECVAVLRRAADAAPAGGPDRLVIRVNLGNALRTQAVAASSATSRDEAVTVLRSALEDAGRVEAARADAAVNLASALLTPSGAAPAVRADLDEAVGLLRAAVDLVGDEGVDAPRYRAGLGRALHARFRAYGRAADADDGLAALAAAARTAGEVDLELALGVARHWAAWAGERGNHAAAASGYLLAVSAARRLVAEQVLVEHKRSWLRAAVGLHSDAALCFASTAASTVDGAGSSVAALALESGRALLLADELGLRRADVGRLDHAQPALARRFRQAVARLRATSGAGAPGTARSLPVLDSLP